MTRARVYPLIGLGFAILLLQTGFLAAVMFNIMPSGLVITMKVLLFASIAAFVVMGVRLVRRGVN
jgi:hypothetical protein